MVGVPGSANVEKLWFKRIVSDFFFIVKKYLQMQFTLLEGDLKLENIIYITDLSECAGIII